MAKGRQVYPAFEQAQMLKRDIWVLQSLQQLVRQVQNVIKAQSLSLIWYICPIYVEMNTLKDNVLFHS